MRLFINDKHFIEQSIEIEKFNHVIAGNGKGKTSFLSVIKECFEGKNSKYYSLNGNLINKDDYLVFYIGEKDSVDLEKNLGAKSFLKNELKNTLLDMDDEFASEINNRIFNLVKMIKQEILEKTSLGTVGLDLELELDDILLKNAIVTIEEEVYTNKSCTEQRIAYIKMIINRIKNLNRPCVLIIDEPFMNLSESNKYELSNYLYETLKDTQTITFISSSSECIDNFNAIYCLNCNVSNTILNKDDYYQIAARLNNCSLNDAYNYIDDEEINSLKDKIDKEYSIESKFINDTSERVNISEFVSKILKNIV